MRPVFLCCVLSTWLFLLPQQSDIWRNVKADGVGTDLHAASLASRQIATIRSALAARVKLDSAPCAEGFEPDWTEKVTFGELPISTTGHIILVQAGPGCARGGQGANGAMWIVQFKGGKLSFLATPQHEFFGWLYSVQPTTSHGLRDLVLGWHMHAGRDGFTLSYFRFDGALYRRIGAAHIVVDDNNVTRIVPDSAS